MKKYLIKGYQLFDISIDSIDIWVLPQYCDMENDDYIVVETTLLQMHMLGQSQAVHACLNTNK